MMPSDCKATVSGPLKARMMNQAKARNNSLTHMGTINNSRSVARLFGEITLAM
jgi:hypothetical protein